MRTAARRSITCTSTCLAGGRSDLWLAVFRKKKRTADEKEKGHAGEIARHDAAVHRPETHGGQKATLRQRCEKRTTPHQAARNIPRQSTQRPAPRVIPGDRALSAWVSACLGRP